MTRRIYKDNYSVNEFHLLSLIKINYNYNIKIVY